MKSTFQNALSATALLVLLSAGSAPLHAQVGTAPAWLAHCNWGDFGCTNPPPVSPRALPAPRLAAVPARAQQACDPVLSSPGECWTNCQTEDDITICDIVKTGGRKPD
jgi:hypothetical protein